MANQHSKKLRGIRQIPDDLWDALGAEAEAGDTDRSAITRTYYEWYMGLPGAQLPDHEDRETFNQALEVLGRPGVSDADKNWLNEHLGIRDVRKQAGAVRQAHAQLRADVRLTDGQKERLRVALNRANELLDSA